MCGRYSETKMLEAHDRRMRLKSQITGFTPRYNIAPTQDAPVVVREEENVLKLMRWGLVPPWAEDECIGNRMINTRAETLDGAVPSATKIDQPPATCVMLGSMASAPTSCVEPHAAFPVRAP